MVIQPEHKSPPAIRGPGDECVSVPEVHIKTDSEIVDLESIAGHIAGEEDEGGSWDGMEGDANDLEVTPI